MKGTRTVNAVKCKLEIPLTEISFSDVAGVITASKILLNMSEGKIAPNDAVSKIVDPVRKFDTDVSLDRISAVIQKEGFALIKKEKGKYT